MRLWKILLIVAVVAGGYWTGYTMKDRKSEAKPVGEPPTPSSTVAVPSEPKPPVVDPSLILPPPPEQGAMIDIPIADIRKEFLDKAGLTPTIEPVVEGPMLPLPEPNRLPIELPPAPRGKEVIRVKAENPPLILDPPMIDPIRIGETPRPPVIRLPAPAEEPQGRTNPVVNRVVHRQVANWMYVNHRSLQLNFDITKRGSSGIKAVELWARRLGDQEYECVDRMEGDKPPFTTRLWSEGNYEFRLVCVGGSSMRSPNPKRDDLPDLYVCLDTTPPLVELLSPGTAEPNVVKLRWKATDANLSDQPIRLEYSVDGECWHSVADPNTWLPNTGEYLWNLPARLPHELHVRVRARDKAGNIGEARTPSKFSVDLVVPEGRISGVVETAPEPRVEAESTHPRILAEYSPTRKPVTERGANKAVPIEPVIEVPITLIPPSYSERQPVSGESSDSPELLPMPRDAQINNWFWWQLLGVLESDETQSPTEAPDLIRIPDPPSLNPSSTKRLPIAAAPHLPGTIFDDPGSAYHRAKGYDPIHFARLPERKERFVHKINRWYLTSLPYGVWQGAEELDPSPELYQYQVDGEEHDLPPPSRPDRYLLNRHASFLELLRLPHPSVDPFLNRPMFQRSSFDGGMPFNFEVD